MRLRSSYSDPTTMRLWDALTFFWVVFWVVVGGWTGYEIWQLTGLSDSVMDAGQALNTAGRALQDLGGVPLVGDRTRQLGDQIVGTAAGIVDNGASSARSIRALSVLIGLAIGVGPIGPVMVVHLPRRRALRRDIADIAETLRTHGRTPAVMAHLAHRAMGTFGFFDLLRITPDPAADLAAGRYEALAGAELGRLGMSLPEPGP